MKIFSASWPSIFVINSLYGSVFPIIFFYGFKDMSDEDVIDKLCALKGIGEWTAQMYLMFSLGRSDVFPTGDLGIVNAVTALYEFKDPASETDMLQISQSWRPHRTIASWYLWQALDLFRDGEW